MAEVILDRPVQSIDGESCIVSSNIRINGEDVQIRYKVSSGPVSQTSDTLVAAGLLPAMLTGSDLRVEGRVSPKLLRATDTVQDIVKAWFPGYTSVSVKAQTSNGTGLTDDRGVGAFFSGGIDAFYTLLKHRDEITTLIFVHGYDIRLEHKKFLQRASGSVREVASAFDKVLIEVETDLFESLEKISPRFVPPGGDAHGAAMASIAHLLSPRLKKVYIPSSYPYSNLNPWGSHVLLDPLWSTEDVEIIHDGSEAARLEKMPLVGKSDIALNNLRICFFKPEYGLNCGECEKCLRSMASLRAVGVLDRCNTFNKELDLEALAKVKIPYKGLYRSYQDILKTVEKNANDPELAKALHKCLSRNEYIELTEKLNEKMVPLLESTTGKRFLESRRNTFFKYLWQANPGWMTREVLKENIKRADRMLLGGIINKLLNAYKQKNKESGS